MFVSGPRSAAKAMRRPSGAQAVARTSKSPRVSWRAVAPVRNGRTHRCVRRSTWPESSSRKSRRISRRATGVRPFRSCPTMNRGSAEGATIASRSPDGLQGHAQNAVFEIGQPPRLAAVERQRPRLGDRIRFADRGAHERQPAPIGRHRRRGVTNATTRELTGPTAAGRSRPQVRLVLAATDAAQGVDRRGSVGSQAERLERDLGVDERFRGCAL